MVTNTDSAQQTVDNKDENEEVIAQNPVEEEVKQPVEEEAVVNTIPADYKGPRYYVIDGCFESKQKAEDLIRALGDDVSSEVQLQPSPVYRRDTTIDWVL